MRTSLIFLLFIFTLQADTLKSKIDHIFVIYLENRSFDNLFRGFEGADTSDKPFKPYSKQIDENGTVYKMIPMSEEDISTSLPKEISNKPFLLDNYISKNHPIPDLVHRFYQNQLQIDGGKNDRFAAVSDSKGLVMGYHDIKNSALWHYAKEFTLCDHFFMGAFGGSFLNHQWLIAARAPKVDANSTLSRYELGKNGEIIKDGILTPDNYAVNTVQPYNMPYDARFGDPSQRLPALTYDTIGDRLSEKHISWTWYSGGYDTAMKGDGKSVDYQYHHNPFAYFKRYAVGTEGRKHLKDEKDLFKDLKNNTLPHVVFFKPSALENQHPGYANIEAGDAKLQKLVESIKTDKKLWKSSIIIITYDENGGLWDHAEVPKVDRWGLGTRIPAIIISPFAKKGFIDHTQYDTTSILRFIEWRYGLKKLGKRKSENLLNTFKR